MLTLGETKMQKFRDASVIHKCSHHNSVKRSLNGPTAFTSDKNHCCPLVVLRKLTVSSPCSSFIGSDHTALLQHKHNGSIWHWIHKMYREIYIYIYFSYQKQCNTQDSQLETIYVCLYKMWIKYCTCGLNKLDQKRKKELLSLLFCFYQKVNTVLTSTSVTWFCTRVSVL